MIQQLPQNNIIPTGVVSNIGDIAAGNSVLFLFSPREIINHHKRPLVYNFNNEMMNSISEHIVNRPSAQHSVRKVQNGTPSIHQAIVPASQGGINVNTQKYSDNWMFVLIIDDDSRQNIMQSNKLLTRSILIGICAQEPISHSGMMSMTPEQFLNPNCQLIVTKRIQMTKYGTLGVHGYDGKTKTVVNDNIVQFDQSIWGGTQGSINQYPRDQDSYFTMTPGEIYNTTSYDQGDITSIVSVGESINVKGTAKIASTLESPRQHMKEILVAIESGSANSTYANDIGTFGEGVDHFSDPKLNFVTHVHSALDESKVLNNSSVNLTMQDITTTFLSIGMVMGMYHPKIFPIITPVHSNADIIPQHHTNINNVFASLVCAVLPTYLNSIGLSAVSFMYNSYHEAFNLLHIESAINLQQQELQFKWNALMHLVTTELFPVLFGNGGHFDLQVMSSVNSTTDVVLNFLDFTPIPVGAIYQENAILGGIVSPLVGTTSHLQQNSVQLNQLINNVGASIHH